MVALNELVVAEDVDKYEDGCSGDTTHHFSSSNCGFGLFNDAKLKYDWECIAALTHKSYSIVSFYGYEYDISVSVAHVPTLSHLKENYDI